MPLRGYKLANIACVIQLCLAMPSDFGDSNKVACLMVFNIREQRNQNIEKCIQQGIYVNVYIILQCTKRPLQLNMHITHQNNYHLSWPHL